MTMESLLKTLDNTNATLDSVDRRRMLRRSESCKGVPGLPKTEDFLMPRYVELDRARVEEMVKESQECKRPLVADPGGRVFNPNVYLAPKTLTVWQMQRAIMPPRSYKKWLGLVVPDKRELYRFRAQADEAIPEADPEMMGEQHKKWMVGHNRQRQKHLHPIYFHKVACQRYEAEKERRVMNAADGSSGGAGADGAGAGGGGEVDEVPRGINQHLDIFSGGLGNYAENVGGATDAGCASGGSSSKQGGSSGGKQGGLSKTQSLPALKRPESPPPDKPALSINPPLWKYTFKGTRLFGLAYPHQLHEEQMTMEDQYLGVAKGRIAELDRRHAEKMAIEARRLAELEKDRKRKGL